LTRPETDRFAVAPVTLLALLFGRVLLVWLAVAVVVVAIQRRIVVRIKTEAVEVIVGWVTIVVDAVVADFWCLLACVVRTIRDTVTIVIYAVAADLLAAAALHLSRIPAQLIGSERLFGARNGITAALPAEEVCSCDVATVGRAEAFAAVAAAIKANARKLLGDPAADAPTVSPLRCRLDAAHLEFKAVTGRPAVGEVRAGGNVEVARRGKPGARRAVNASVLARWADSPHIPGGEDV
jgi:hypothetical protein